MDSHQGDTRTACEIVWNTSRYRSSFLLKNPYNTSPPSEVDAVIHLFWILSEGAYTHRNLHLDQRTIDFMVAPIGRYRSRLELVAHSLSKLSHLTDRDIHIWYYTAGIHQHRLSVYITAEETRWLSTQGAFEGVPPEEFSVLDRIAGEALAPGGLCLDTRESRLEAKSWISTQVAKASFPPWFRLAEEMTQDELTSSQGRVGGVNIIGHATNVLGFGEDTRSYASALHAGQVPIAISNVELLSAPESSVGDRAFLRCGDHLPYDVNLMAVSPFVAEGERLRGSEIKGRTFSIASWAWELPAFPDCWSHLTRFYDEIWAVSPFVVESLAGVTDVPVIYMPPLVQVERGSFSDACMLPLEPEFFNVLVMFDYNSHFSRKNPLASIAAFRKAFPSGDGAKVRLLIKTLNAGAHPAESEALQAAVGEDARIFVADGSFSRLAVLDLLSRVDCFVSLHRSEGFGRIIAEAMLLGTTVIATGYSGSAAFLDDSVGYPVPYDLATVDRSCYPYASGAVWAEPDVDAAATLLRVVGSGASEVARKRENARCRIEENHGLKAVAGGLRRRLAEISDKLAASSISSGGTRSV